MCHPSWQRALTAAQQLRDLAAMRRVRDRIDREYAQPLDLEALARGAHMSAGDLSRQFRAAYGKSPDAYLMIRRIERAREVTWRTASARARVGALKPSSVLGRCGRGGGTISAVTAPVHDVLAESRAALRIGDAAGARRLLEGPGADPTSGAVLEGLAQTSYLQFDFVRCVEEWERAYAAHRRPATTSARSEWPERWRCVHLMILGNGAVGSGWLARAQTLLGDAADSPEAGWVALDIGMFEGDRSRKVERFRQALERARRTGDTDLEFVALAYLGAALVHADRTVEGMALLDESLAAVAGNDVEDFFILEDIFCQLFAACEHACDVQRADEWIRVGEAIAARRKLPAVSAFCRTHYGGVLTTAGRWPEAEAALTDAIRLWGLGQRSALRSGALVRLAELRVRQGRYEEAEQLLEGLDSHVAGEAARPSRPSTSPGARPSSPATSWSGRWRRSMRTSAAAAPLLALLRRRAPGRRPTRCTRKPPPNSSPACAERTPAPHLVATAALARGLVCLATGDDPKRACARPWRGSPAPRCPWSSRAAGWPWRGPC